MAAPTFVADEIVTAAKMNSLPKGQLAYAQITANQSGITTVVDISGLSVTFDAGTSRRIRTTVYVWSLTSTVTADRGHGFIRSGTGTNIQQWVHRFTGTNGEDGLRMDVVETLSGSHTRKVCLPGVCLALVLTRGGLLLTLRRSSSSKILEGCNGCTT